MSEQKPQPSPPPEKPSPEIDLQSVKAQEQATSSKPDKSVPAPKYIQLANDRIANE